MKLWSDDQIETAKGILSNHVVYQDALEEIGELVGREISSDTLASLFRRRGLNAPTSYCQTEEEGAEEEANTPQSGLTQSEALKEFFKITKKGPLSFSTLCDKLDMSPSKTKTLIEEAKTFGMKVHIEHDHVGIKAPTPDDRIQSIGIAPVVGQRQKIAVISDTHLGSKYCLREQLKEFILYAYDQGVREILHPGDVLDGMYRHGMWEVSHSGLDAQAEDLFEVLPALPGLNYRCITGNHDFTFTEGVGVDVGQYLSGFFRDRGRKDLHFYGNRGAFLKVKGALVHLWHPKSGAGYARSYAIQKHIEKYSSAEKPNILLTGHWHIYCHVYERGVHGIACPTFQGGGSAFSKSLGGAPAIGGLLLSWDLTAHGTVRSFSLEKRSYFEQEKPHVIEEEREEIMVPEPPKRVRK